MPTPDTTNQDKEALSASFGRHPRERSFSDSTHATDVTIMAPDDDAIVADDAPGNAQMTIDKKHSRVPRRPRSKSCDHRHHRHPTHHRKKKCSAKRNVPGFHSPNRHHHIVHAGRVSPKSTVPCQQQQQQQQLRGRIWIRPVTVVRNDSSPYGPCGDRAFAPVRSPARHVADSLVYQEDAPPNSFFDRRQLQRHGSHGNGGDEGPKSARIIFGESGKPIRPRPAF